MEYVAVAKVDHVDVALVAVFTDDLDAVAASEDCEVAGKGESTENGDLVACDGEGPGAVDLTEDADLEVEELDGDDGVLDVAAGDDLVTDEILELPAGLATGRNGAEDGEIDVAVIVDDVAEKPLLAAALHEELGTCLVRSNGEVELRRQDRGPAGDHYRELVFGLDDDTHGLVHRHSRVGGDVLEVVDLLVGRGLAGEKNE